MVLAIRISAVHNRTQRRPAGGLHEEAALMVMRASAATVDAFDDLFRPYGITATQYNALRILRGAGDDGLCRNDVICRMVTRMPDVTRLLDRLENAGYVKRARSARDGRMVTTTLTRAGAKLLAQLDPIVTAAHRRRLGHLTATQLRTLIRLLTLATEGN